MAKTPFFKSKLFKVIKMTILGAILPLLIMWLSGIGYKIWGHGHAGDWGPVFWMGLAWIEYIPAGIVAEAMGFKNGPPSDPYVVNCLLGAGLAAAISVLCQYGVKGPDLTPRLMCVHKVSIKQTVHDSTAHRSARDENRNL